MNLLFLSKKRPLNIISYPLCGTMLILSLLLLYLVDGFFSAIYYIDFQSKLQSLALSNQIQEISTNIEFEIYLGENLEYLEYASYIHSELEAGQFKSVDRALKVRKFPRSSTVDQLRINSIKLRKLDQEFQLSKRAQDTVIDDDIMLISSSSNKDKEIEIVALQEESLMLSRELLLRLSTKPPSFIDAQVYKKVKPLIESWFNCQLEEFPVIPK